MDFKHETHAVLRILNDFGCSSNRSSLPALCVRQVSAVLISTSGFNPLTWERFSWINGETCHIWSQAPQHVREFHDGLVNSGVTSTARRNVNATRAPVVSVPGVMSVRGQSAGQVAPQASAPVVISHTGSVAPEMLSVEQATTYTNADGMRYNDGRYDAFKTDLAAVVPKSRLFTDPVHTFAYGTDASFYRLNPQMVIKVNNEAEIIQVCIPDRTRFCWALFLSEGVC